MATLGSAAVERGARRGAPTLNGGISAGSRRSVRFPFSGTESPSIWSMERDSGPRDNGAWVPKSRIRASAWATCSSGSGRHTSRRPPLAGSTRSGRGPIAAPGSSGDADGKGGAHRNARHLYVCTRRAQRRPVAGRQRLHEETARLEAAALRLHSSPTATALAISLA
jgi:hypothetical protein